VDLLFLGDSITDGWAKGGKAIWDTRYAPLKAANFGIGGDKTEHVLWRLKNGNLTGIQPKVVVLMIGTNNNLRDTAPGLPRASPQSFRKSALNRPPARSCCSRCFPGRKNPPMPGGLRLLK
jgi:lysophospholipase L1-like esterase